MGIVRTRETRMAELEEFRRMLIECAGVYRIPKGEEDDDEELRMETKIEEEDQEEEEKLVCVTSGISFLGLAIVNRLLDRGYSVRIAVDNEEDLEKLREMEMFVEVRGGSNNNNNSNGNGNRVTAVTAKMTDLGSLCEAFRGCRGVFHTSAFADPAGVSGYSKYMAELEMKASENVMEACRRTESVRKCVFTSSLLACIWRDTSIHDLPHILDHNCWSEESICRDKKLWYALGKTMAEKAAWRVAEESEVKLVTICPALVTGPEFCHRNPTASVAYLKGAQDMYAEGLLATTDINRVADAHVRIYQAMRRRASGRYICFDHVMGRAEEVEELARNVGMLPVNIIGSSNVNTPSDSVPCPRFKLCNRKLSTLMSRRLHCS